MSLDTVVSGKNVPSYLPDFPPKHTYSRKVKKSKNVEQRDTQIKTITRHSIKN